MCSTKMLLNPFSAVASTPKSAPAAAPAAVTVTAKPATAAEAKADPKAPRGKQKKRRRPAAGSLKTIRNKSRAGVNVNTGGSGVNIT